MKNLRRHDNVQKLRQKLILPKLLVVILQISIYI